MQIQMVTVYQMIQCIPIRGTTSGTNPNDADTDGDGVNDN